MNDQTRVELKLDVGVLREIIGVAVRRASAFLSISLHQVDKNPPASYEVTAGMTYRFWPAEISEDDKKRVNEEYRNWVIGACFRELEQHYGIFLDKIGWSIEVANAHGQTVPSDTVFGRRYSQNTNTAAKQKEIAEILGADDHFFEINSISMARNCLVHNLGIVRSPRDCNDEQRNSLTIRWNAIDFVLERDGHRMDVTSTPADTQAMPGSGDLTALAEYNSRERVFAAGTRIGLEDHQISELCFFYHVLAEQMITSLMKYLQNLNIPTAEASAG